MKIIFCSEPFFPNQVDSVYAEEFESAQNAGFNTGLIDFEVLTREQNSEIAVKRIQPFSAHDTLNNHLPSEVAVYRGWMLKPEIYNKLRIALGQKGIYLLNSYESYRHAHYLPECYKIIQECTPLTVWFPLEGSPDFDYIMKRLSIFGNKPLILKDYVKSRKHEWNEACFIPSASDRASVKHIVNRFLELQGDDLNIGLVFREFIELQKLAEHSKSKMPLSLEYRVFFLFGEPIFTVDYWEEGNYEPFQLPNTFAEIAKEVESDFFTMDVAKQADGNWIIIEIGDAQVSGLPENADVQGFYKSLMKNLKKHEFLFAT